MFKIQIKNIQIPMYLGIYEWEKNHLRNVTVSLTLYCDENSQQQRLCYDEICQHLAQYHYQSFALIENLIDIIGEDLLSNFTAIDSMIVKIKKGLALRGSPTKISIEKKFSK